MKDFYYRHLNRFKHFLLTTLYKNNTVIHNCKFLEDGTVSMVCNEYEKYGLVSKNTLIRWHFTSEDRETFIIKREVSK